jgi:hypothetical protein
MLVARRRCLLLHRIVLVTLAGRECHVSVTVPINSINLFVVTMYSGGKVNRIHMGVTSSILTNKAVNAGLVVALVAVLCVDRKSVSLKNGSRSILHLLVNNLRLSTISSKLFACLRASDSVLLWSLAPDVAVELKLEKRREYMPRMRSTTTTGGPPHRTSGSP